MADLPMTYTVAEQNGFARVRLGPPAMRALGVEPGDSVLVTEKGDALEVRAL